MSIPPSWLVETWTGTSKSSAVTDTLYGYNALGQLASTTIVKQNSAAPAQTTSAGTYYDAVGDSISTTNPTVLDTYDANGRVVKVTYPNGTETDTNYGGFWTPGGSGVFGTETITNKRGSTVLSSFAYSFDADRRKISDLEFMTDSGETATNAAFYTWSYDANSRVIGETYDYANDDATVTKTADDYTDSYTYDLNSNRITKTHISGDSTKNVKVTSTYNGDNQITADTTDTTVTPSGNRFSDSYVYDANGSTSSVTHVDSSSVSTTSTYTYDVRNRMMTYTSGGTTTTYTYDADGNIVGQQIGSATAGTYLLDSHNPTGYVTRLEEWQGTTFKNSYVISNRVVGQLSGTTPSFFLHDGEGSTREITLYTPSTTSTNGQVQGRYDFNGFGEKITLTGHAINSIDGVFRFQGEPIDLQTNMTIMGVREYAPGLDRFWTQDSFMSGPGGLADSNLYLGLGGNPLNIFDPSGHFSLSELTSSEGIQNQLAGMRLPQGLSVYNTATNVREAVQMFSQVIRGAPYDGVSAILFGRQFIPIGGVLEKLGSKFVGAAKGTLSGVKKDLNELFKDSLEYGGKTKDISQLVGDAGAAVTSKALGLTETGFTAAYRGVDGLLQDAAGNFVIVEAKGASSRLASGQLGSQWIKDRIYKLISESGHLDEAIVTKLQDQVNNGSIRALLVSTPIAQTVKGPIVQAPNFWIKSLTEIKKNGGNFF